MLEGVIARMHPQIRAQEREIEKLRRAGVGTALAELLLRCNNRRALWNKWSG
jgi:hypothetical protein